MKADQHVCGVFGSSYAVDEPCCGSLDRLQTLGETDWQTEIAYCYSSPAGSRLNCKTTDTGLVNRAVCLLISQLLLVHILSTPEGWPG